ncbi:MAG: sugar ABC transporter permease [Firmicutes bacterium]|nr:sugar ABC transporter permease [Bacillota bacterium]
MAIFFYLPIWGWFMAFFDYKPTYGSKIFRGKYVGLKYFKELFSDDIFLRALRNTLAMSVLKMLFGITFAILLALIINEIRNRLCRKLVQTISYLPHFISWVVAASIITSVLSYDGIFNELLVKLRVIREPVIWMGRKEWFWWIIALTDVWKEVGWNAIIYLGTMTAISPLLYESAEIDGATRLHKIRYITLPGIMPVASLMFIIQCGFLINSGFEQQWLLSNPSLKEMSDVIDLFVIQYGIALGRYLYTTAAGIFKSVISVILLLGTNAVSRKLTGVRVV